MHEPELEVCLLVVTVASLALGAWGICWARQVRTWRSAWGRRLFVAALLTLGSSSLLAALHRADGLVGLSLTAALLVVCMLWERPDLSAPVPHALPEEM